ncbi:calmodulin-binding transcription activator 2 isoform 3 [Cricetulus griseus]|nr:calmodulin-binding transcription activator 2 isoform 3 [Cricetulus griseus]
MWSVSRLPQQKACDCKLLVPDGNRPQNGSMILYNRKKVKYRKDGYCWKKRKDGKTTREDHMKLKVQGVEEQSQASVSLTLPSVASFLVTFAFS